LNKKSSTSIFYVFLGFASFIVLSHVPLHCAVIAMLLDFTWKVQKLII